MAYADYMEIIPFKIEPDKVKRPPKNLIRENMHRHITRRKKRKGAHVGIVQEVYAKNRRMK